jgi:mannose-6-phosphate isomerase-like protein (cupin superfamily)
MIGRDTSASLWAPDCPPTIGYSFMRTGEGRWQAGREDSLEYRQLGVGEASAGAVGVRHLRAGPQTSARWHAHQGAFFLWFILHGSVSVESEDGRTSLSKWDAAYYPSGVWHREAAMSPGFSAIEVTVPADPRVLSAARRPARRTPSAERPQYSFEHSGYGRHAVRTYLQQRNLGVAALTDGRIDAIVAKPAGAVPPDGTGWHHHSMAQIVVVLNGRVQLEVDGHHDATFLEAGDVMSFGAGMRHLAGSQSDDYVVFTIRMPEKFDTTIVDGPLAASTSARE